MVSCHCAHFISFRSGFLLTILLFFATVLYAAPKITIVSPQTGEVAGSPVFYEAYAVSSACSKGIASIRVSSAPGVTAFTTQGDHLETFLTLQPGTHNTVVQTWDNCGQVSKTVVVVKVTAATGVTVYLPSSKTAQSPVHVAASAQSSACSKGIAAMRLSAGPQANAYSINANQLDAYISLPVKSYTANVQAWDKCGGVFKASFPLTTSPAAEGYLYSSYGGGPDIGSDKNIARINVNADGVLHNPNGSGDPPKVLVPGADSLAADPGGWFLYVSSSKGIYGFQINPVNGSLHPIKGSPFPAPQGIVLAMDSSGNFLYSVSTVAASYRINRSSGALSATNKSISLPFGAVPFTVSGPYLYLLQSASPPRIAGYRLNANSGVLSAVPGSPYKSPSPGNLSLAAIAASGKYLFAGMDFSSSSEINGEIFTYTINTATGALSLVPGSPLLPPRENQQLSSLWADVTGKFAWAWWQDTNGPNNEIATYQVENDGSLVPTGFALQSPYAGAFNNLMEDQGGKHIFTHWQNSSEQGIAAWNITNGDLVLAGHLALQQTFPAFASFALQNQEALVRKHPN
jgi:6-phosphogluconolactonase (cycloisomerase 2 family)